VADIAGPEAEEFLLKVQQATAGPPWYMESPDKVISLSPYVAVAYPGVWISAFLFSVIHIRIHAVV